MAKNLNNLEKNFEATTALFGENAVMLEELYGKYLNDPNSVDESWRDFFNQIPKVDTHPLHSTAKVLGVNYDENLASPVSGNKDTAKIVSASENINLMLEAYRKYGHFLATLDPLKLEKLPDKRDLKLDPVSYGIEKNENNIKLIARLDNIYCSNVGAEFSHVNDTDEQNWLYAEFEKFSNYPLVNEDKLNALADLTKAESFEQFLHTKFPGAKRFSVEGGEGSIVALNRITANFAKSNGRQIIIGMAHRGRLNTLANVIDKPYKAIFSEFLGTSPFPSALKVAGDVKYHMGFTSTKNIRKTGIKLSLAANPSHLEAVNCVVAGSVRAKQDLLEDKSKSLVLGILVHGDAAFCGQGVVAENIVSAPLKAYNIQGIIHIIINNQIGFTADPDDAHSGRYVTEVAKISGSPILHVNGDDAESILKAADFALNYRNKFGKDIVIDIVCYRKYGHNEGDEPAYTQSLMYKAIRNKKTPAAIYADKLLSSNIIDANYYDNFKKQFKEILDKEYLEAKDYRPSVADFKDKNQSYSQEFPITGLKQDLLQDLCAKLCTLPKDFAVHPKLKTLLDQRLQDIQNNIPIDWACAETLAYASLLTEKKSVRLIGQDSARGTFSHRHSVLYDQENGKQYVTLNNLSQDQAPFFVADSNLTEYFALGFEYGYSTVDFNNLVIWEAQFGDFANGAQIIIDQFISSGKTKWLQDSNLVMLLPHGYEGQGPEHSSARLERFLSIAADYNMQVAYPTTPASIFHLLRRQINGKNKLPLIVMSPKSLLRHKLAVSNLSDLDKDSKFIPVLDDSRNDITAKNIEKIICCSGKVYYDLLEGALKYNVKNTAIIRFEEIYPFAKDQFCRILEKYKDASEFIWAQEEPKNMGAWSFIAPYLNDCIQGDFKYIGREAASSPACGYLYKHNKEQEELIKSALSYKK